MYHDPMPWIFIGHMSVSHLGKSCIHQAVWWYGIGQTLSKTWVGSNSKKLHETKFKCGLHGQSWYIFHVVYNKAALSSPSFTRGRGSWSRARCQLVCPHFVASRLTTLPLGAAGGLRSLIVALPGDLFIVFLPLVLWNSPVYTYLWQLGPLCSHPD